jgi:N-acetyl-D-muramate 6-phosphate phosphatase
MRAGSVAKTGRFPKLALFDLDGTLLDSAPDFLAVINRMRADRGHGPMAMETLRPVVSKGARAMAAAAFPDVDAAQREAWIPEFLDLYRHELGRHGQPFDGVMPMLDALEAGGTLWGIVTNKPAYLAKLLMPLLGWETRCAILIGGDTLPVRKPDPLPLLHAAATLGIDARDCAYVGDDERDILAARAAGMPSVVALWGYRLDQDDPFAWQGDALVHDPHQLCDPAAWPSQ